jgi:hypothetical protein
MYCDPIKVWKLFKGGNYSRKYGMSSHRNSSDGVQKAVDLTTPAKDRRKMSTIDLNFQIKKFMILACMLV